MIKEKTNPKIVDELPEQAHILHPNRNTQKKKPATGDSPKSRNPKKEEGAMPESRPQVTSQPIEWPYRLDKEALVQLASFQAPRCISLYIPAHNSGAEVNMLSDAALCKTMLQQIDQRLQHEDIGREKIDQWLAPVRNLCLDADFWRNQSQGLAIFVAEGFCRYMKLPVAPTQEWLVNDNFMLTPLLPFMTSETKFYILSLSKNQAKLFRGDNYGLTLVEVPGMPANIHAVIGEYKADGIGAGQPDEKQETEKYFSEVSKAIEKEVLSKEEVPLLLAAVDYLHPIYQRAAHYKHIVPGGLKGNYDRTTLPELDRAARETLQPLLDQQVQRWLDHYGNQSATALTNSIPGEVIAAAHFGQVGRLFIEQGAHIWGHFDMTDSRVDIHDTQQPGDDCLINETAVNTLLHGGYIHILPKEKMPAPSPLAALLRYP